MKAKTSSNSLKPSSFSSDCIKRYLSSPLKPLDVRKPGKKRVKRVFRRRVLIRTRGMCDTLIREVLEQPSALCSALIRLSFNINQVFSALVLPFYAQARS